MISEAIWQSHGQSQETSRMKKGLQNLRNPDDSPVHFALPHVSPKLPKPPRIREGAHLAL